MSTFATKLETARLVYRLGGLAALARRASAKLGYRSVLVYELPLDSPPVPVEPKLPMTFRFLRPDELDAFDAHCPELGRAKVESMLAEGNRCFVGCIGDEIAASGWVRRGPATLESLNVDLELTAGQAYVHNAYTAVRHRGNRALPALGTRLATIMASEGCTAEIALIAFDNLPGKRNAEHIGHRKTDTLAELSLGPVHIPLRRARRTPARFSRTAGSTGKVASGTNR